jgi:hypothetical protein
LSGRFNPSDGTSMKRRIFRRSSLSFRSFLTSLLPVNRAERYGERLKPSPFLVEIAGRERRFCVWTGPKLNGADDRLPLLAPDEQKSRVALGESAAASHPPNRNLGTAAVRAGKGAKMPKR